MNEVAKFLSSEGVVSIGIMNNYFIVKKETEIIIIRLLEGEFPEYTDIIKKDDVHRRSYRQKQPDHAAEAHVHSILGELQGGSF